MKLLQEALKDFGRIGTEEEAQEDPLAITDESPEDDLEGGDPAGEESSEGEQTGDELADADQDEFGEPGEEAGDPFSDDNWGTPSGGAAGGAISGTGETDPLSDPSGDESTDGEADPDLDGIVNQAVEDPDRQGLIRAVKKAHLVYKRQTEDGTYEELWMYNIGTMRDEMQVRKAILAGTDIPTNKTRSPDGAQEYKLWSAGNAELLIITGLQN